MGDSIEKLFVGTECLAPMVRVGSLPFRLLALNHGANTVWGEEIIDRKVISTTRVENKERGTIDYISGRNLVFRTCDVEQGRVVFQIGSSSASFALEAASKVEKDVAAIDINMGCPKKFSLQGGMGSALLKNPEVACDIIRTLRKSLSIPVTAKIRLLDTPAHTLEFVRQLESAGAMAITIHARRADMLPKDPALWDQIHPIVDAVQIPVIANGDIYTRTDIDAIKKISGCSSVMLARPALFNCSIFDKSALELKPQADIVRDYLQLCSKYQEHYKNAKYVCMEMMTMRRHPTHLHGKLRIHMPDAPSLLDVSRTKSLQDLLQLWNVNGLRGVQDKNALSLDPDRRYDDDFFLDTLELSNGQGSYEDSNSPINKKQRCNA